MKKKEQDHVALSAALLGLSFVAFMLTGGLQPAKAGEKKQEAQAIEVTGIAPTADEISSVIEQQLEAIKTRIAAQAFASTTTGFHEKYEDATSFLSEMRFSHRPLYNHQSFRFLDRVELEDGLIQKIEVDDVYTGPTIVIYHLKQSEDGKWLIDSFSLLDTDDGQQL